MLLIVVPKQGTELNLKNISATGTALSSELEAKIKEQFLKYQKTQPAFGQIYGSTEINIGGMASSWSPRVNRNSVKKIYKSKDFKVEIRKDGKICEVNEKGDMWIFRYLLN